MARIIPLFRLDVNCFSHSSWMITATSFQWDAVRLAVWLGWHGIRPSLSKFVGIQLFQGTVPGRHASVPFGEKSGSVQVEVRMTEW